MQQITVAHKQNTNSVIELPGECVLHYVYHTLCNALCCSSLGTSATVDRQHTVHTVCTGYVHGMQQSIPSLPHRPVVSTVVSTSLNLASNARHRLTAQSAKFFQSDWPAAGERKVLLENVLLSVSGAYYECTLQCTVC